MKISEMEFPRNDSTVPFKLADGHLYFLHRLTRDGKPTVYSLLAAEGASGSFTPYLPAHQMERVLDMRSSPAGAASGTLDVTAPTGYRCPGCGAVTTETGTHVGPAEPGKAESFVHSSTGPDIIVNDDEQIELIPKPRSLASRFFESRD